MNITKQKHIRKSLNTKSLTLWKNYQDLQYQTNKRQETDKFWAQYEQLITQAKQCKLNLNSRKMSLYSGNGSASLGRAVNHLVIQQKPDIEHKIKIVLFWIVTIAAFMLNFGKSLSIVLCILTFIYTISGFSSETKCELSVSHFLINEVSYPWENIKELKLEVSPAQKVILGIETFEKKVSDHTLNLNTDELQLLIRTLRIRGLNPKISQTIA